MKNGGSGIDKYIIQYIASGLPWKSPNVAETKNTKYDELKLPNGRYNARVRAQNKAGRGPPSNEVLINLGKSLKVTHNSLLHCSLQESLLPLHIG